MGANKQSAPPPGVSEAEESPQHFWDKAPDSWRGRGKFESLSEVLLFPVLSILQLGFQLVPLSVGTISHLSPLPQLSPSPPGEASRVHPTGHGKRPQHVPAPLPAGEIPFTPFLESSWDLRLAVTILAWLFLGRGHRLSLLPVQTLLFNRLWRRAPWTICSGTRVLLKFPSISKNRAGCGGAVLKWVSENQ